MKKISAHEIKGLIPTENKEDQQQNREREKLAVGYWSKVVDEILSIEPRWRIEDEQQRMNYIRNMMTAAKDAGVKSQSDVDRALKHLRVSDLPHRPTVGQFVTMCKSASETAGLNHNTQAYTNDWTGDSKKLDYKRTAEQKEKAKSKIAGLKDLLKK